MHLRIDRSVGDVHLAIGDRSDEDGVGGVGNVRLGSARQHPIREGRAGRLCDGQRIEIHHRGAAGYRLSIETLVLQRRADLLRHVLDVVVPPLLVGVQPSFEQRLRRDDDMRPRLDILPIGAILASLLAVLPDHGVEAQPVKHAEAFVAFVESVDVELGRAKACAGGLIENDAHLRREIGACGFLGLPRCIVGVSGIVDRRNFLDRGVARGDVVVFSRFCRRCGGRVRDCGGETERGHQPENGGEGIVHVRWSVAGAVWFKENDRDQPLSRRRTRLNACQASTLCKD